MNINKDGLDLIRSFEGLRLTAYNDGVGVITIGYGTTKHPDGSNIKLGETITKEQAETYFEADVNYFAKEVKKVLTVNLTDNQFSALVSFTYNLGLKQLKNSTLLKMVNLNPNDPKIKDELLKWISKDKPNITKGLIRRRTAEGDLYFKK